MCDSKYWKLSIKFADIWGKCHVNVAMATILLRYPMFRPEDHWSCIAHLIATDMLKSAFFEAKTFKHSPWAGADNPLGPKV